MLAGLVLASVVGLVVLGFFSYIQLFPEKVAGDAIAAWRKNAALVRRELELPGGLRYVYLEGGRGEPLLLLHGFGSDKDNFDTAAYFLTPRYRVIVPDHIGFGESSKPVGSDYSPPAQVAHLRALVKALGLNRIHLGGNSMGGQIALAYAVSHRDEVASLWLLDPAGIWSAPKSELLAGMAAGKRNTLLVETEAEFDELLHLVIGKPSFVPRPVRHVLAQARIRNSALEARIFPQLLAYSVEDKVAGVMVPTLIVWGDQDRVLHVDSAQILHGLLPRSEVIILPQIGHLPMLEAPQRVTEDYVRFRESLARPSRQHQP